MQQAKVKVVIETHHLPVYVNEHLYLINVIDLRTFLSLSFCQQRHSTELNDGADYGRLNLRSVTQQSSLDEFLSIAEMANTDYSKGCVCCTSFRDYC